MIFTQRSYVEKLFSWSGVGGYDNLYINLRDKISEQEIRSTFPTKRPNIKIFVSEEEALSYSRYLRFREGSQGYDRDLIYQPAIYKVNCTKNLENAELKQKSLSIKREFENDPFQERQININVKYYRLNRSEVIPVEGYLRIETDQKNNFKEYTAVAFQKSSAERRFIY